MRPPRFGGPLRDGARPTAVSQAVVESGMIVEQIRYYVKQDQLAETIRARREVSRIRGEAGVPPGQILLADPPDEGPAIIWQCGYADESELGAADAALIGSAEYEKARGHLSALVNRVELELYMIDEDNGSA